MKKYPSEMLPRFMLRIPPDLKHELAVSAEAHRRSINSEILIRLERDLSRGSATERRGAAA